ncbi:MAG: formate dehydrogenase accessory sulfurtransferase FdhD [Nesterenkonia sp.]|uniref:formate dehydrogenase accessory sulfurtransferase FdhD n=1 Tax=Nesterenkonia marinintestina TaxID=2979865 RepID=UPI0021C0E971|nr:formate dehydrogenase accessory sulfurtransferase FdhD [Nesterenkonia sp. GX14115]MDO5492229.1 formate dehydrogenase accessory sulfurtransferase FdhD [Nesterenkonia sp.]
MGRLTARTRIRRFDAAGQIDARADRLAGEEPLEIRLDGDDFAVAMRTPGHDVELVHGFLLSEGIIDRASAVRSIDFASGLDPDGSRNYNVAEVRLGPEARRQAPGRQVYTSSACGICGTASLDAVRKASHHPVCHHTADRGLITSEALLTLPDRLRAEQRIFDATGGTHAAALFRMTGPDEPVLICAREDVGRHNAMDKLLGRALLDGLPPLEDCVVQVSARASFELVQKLAMAGAPLLSAVSAPSSSAVEVGEELGITVVGFNRGRTCNVYSRPGRIIGAGQSHDQPSV